MVSQLYKKPLYLILEQYYENKHAYPHKLVKYAAEKFQFQNLGSKHPYYYKSQYAEKNIDRTALLHYPIKVKKQQSNNGYIKRVTDSELFHN